MGDSLQCGLVLLAAGGSERMGRPKQLLPVNGQPLIRRMVESVLAAPLRPVVVVLGGAAEQVRPAIEGLPVSMAVNPAWREGLSSSLRVGIERALEEAPDLDGIAVVLADQPYLPPGHLEQMRAGLGRKGCTAVVSETNGRKVPPMLFASSWFAKLRSLQGDRGARDLLRDRGSEIATIPLSSNADLDTWEDYERFLRGP